MIPQRNLSLLSNRLARAGGRRIVEAVLERDYCLAWLLVGLSRAPIRETLVFKGGTALKRCYPGDYRFSEDLDFTLAEPRELNGILAGSPREAARVTPCTTSWPSKRRATRSCGPSGSDSRWQRCRPSRTCSGRRDAAYATLG